jgi:O-antigen ligase
MPAHSVTAGPAIARALPAATLVALGVAAAWRERGSVDAGNWLAYAIVAGLVLGAVAASGAAVTPTRWIVGASGCLAGLAAWSALSLTWSPVPPLARDEALLTVLYAVVLLIPALSIRRPVDRTAVSGVVVAALGGVSVATAIHLLRASSPDTVYAVGRLDFPISYPNAQAAMFLVGFWPAIALAARRELPPVVRSLALGSAAALAGGWLLAQSKGGGLGVLASTIVVLAVSRRRLRLVPPLAIVAALVGAWFLPLTEPFRATAEGQLAAIHHAAVAELTLAFVASLLGLGYALLDRRLVLSDWTAGRLGNALLLLVVTAIATGCSVFYASVDDPADFFDAKWETFKHVPGAETGSSHFTSLGSNRYDFWRVSLEELRAHPLAGVGARGFRASYLQHRDSPETPARAHSLELDVLMETGIVGFLLLAGALVCTVAAFARRARDDLVAIGALGAFTCWLVHASVDWTWTFPAVCLPLFALLGAAAGRDEARPLSRRSRPALAVGAVVLALGGFGLPWLSSHYVRAALAGTSDATVALDRARTLDPLSVDPLLAEWALAPNPQGGLAPLREAVRMEPRSADLLFALGRQQRLAGDKAAARRTLRHALRLDPGDPDILAQLAAAR